MNRVVYVQFLVLVVSIFFSTIYAQKIENEEDILITNQDKFIVLSQGIDVSQKKAEQSVSNARNAVFIKQIGVDNSVLSNSVAEYSNIRISQSGDQNKVEINESAKEIEKVISQTGTNNSVIDFSFNQNISTKLELIQEGNNLIFEKFGSNELSKNLKFKMSGDARTIIVRSF